MKHTLVILNISVEIGSILNVLKFKYREAWVHISPHWSVFLSSLAANFAEVTARSSGLLPRIPKRIHILIAFQKLPREAWDVMLPLVSCSIKPRAREFLSPLKLAARNESNFGFVLSKMHLLRERATSNELQTTKNSWLVCHAMPWNKYLRV